MTEPPKRDFLSSLRQSHSTVLIAAEFIRKQNYQVTLLPNKESTDFKNRMDFVDDCDLFINMPVEVKQTLKTNFPRGKKDWPFPTVNVMAAHAWEDKDPKPIFVLVLSKDCKNAIYIHQDTEPHWLKERQTDRRDERSQDVLRCPIDKVKWLKL
jgi:hypothetical protein